MRTKIFKPLSDRLPDCVIQVGREREVNLLFHYRLDMSRADGTQFVSLEFAPE